MKVQAVQGRAERVVPNWSQGILAGCSMSTCHAFQDSITLLDCNERIGSHEFSMP